jgi:hypothetical protein
LNGAAPTALGVLLNLRRAEASNQALEMLRDRKATGKVVITPS